MLRAVRLYYPPALLITSARSACRLYYQLQCPLGRSEVRDIKRHIRRDDTHQSYIPEIQTLGYQLGAYQDMSLSFPEFLQLPLQLSLFPDRIQIYSLRHISREQLGYGLFHFFRATAEILYILAAAFRALMRRLTTVAAVMANSPSAFFMVSQ